MRSPPPNTTKSPQTWPNSLLFRPKYIEECDLRISPFRWFAELIRNKRLIVGRLDSRFTGMNRDAAESLQNTTPARRLISALSLPLSRTTFAAISDGTTTSITPSPGTSVRGTVKLSPSR